MGWRTTTLALTTALALIGNCVPADKMETLLGSINDLSRKPSQLGALLQNPPVPTMKDEPGTGTNGGIFAAINGTLIWALALVNGELAWDEWQKNTLARHAETYPRHVVRYLERA